MLISFIQSFAWYVIAGIHHNLFVHSTTDRYLSCFLFGDILNKVAMNILVYISQ
jgi:hypothetical protein